MNIVSATWYIFWGAMVGVGVYGFLEADWVKYPWLVGGLFIGYVSWTRGIMIVPGFIAGVVLVFILYTPEDDQLA